MVQVEALAPLLSLTTRATTGMLWMKTDIKLPQPNLQNPKHSNNALAIDAVMKMIWERFISIFSFKDSILENKIKIRNRDFHFTLQNALKHVFVVCPNEHNPGLYLCDLPPQRALFFTVA